MVKRAIWSGSGTSFGVHPMGICHLYPYTSPEDTCSTLTDTVQITHAQYPILQAVSNLYLNQKILFQKI